jgi:hypothetical protein
MVSRPARLDIFKWPRSLEETRTAINSVKQLTSDELDTFSYDAAYYLIGAKSGDQGSITRTNGDEPLINVGLVEPTSTDGRPKVQLTEKGVVATRLFVAQWPPPPELATISDEIKEIRDLMPAESADLIKTSA